MAQVLAGLPGMMLMGLGMSVTFVLVDTGFVDAGWAIVWFVCACRIVLGVTLVVTAPRLWKSRSARAACRRPR